MRRSALVEQAAASSMRVFSTRDLPQSTPLGLEEGIGHAAADDQGVDLGQQVFDHLDLVADLGAAEDGDEGARRVGQGLAEVAQLLFHQVAGRRRAQQPGHALGGGVGAVGGAEGVVDIEVGQAGQLPAEIGIVGFFSGMEPQILQQQDLAVAKGCGQVLDGVGRRSREPW